LRSMTTRFVEPERRSWREGDLAFPLG